MQAENDGPRVKRRPDDARGVIVGELIGRHVAQSGGSSDLLMTVLMVASMFGVIYFLMIRPQRKQQ